LRLPRAITNVENAEGCGPLRTSWRPPPPPRRRTLHNRGAEIVTVILGFEISLLKCECCVFFILKVKYWKTGFVPHRKQSKSSLRGGAGKSLVRPGKKQATATKLGIYECSTHSPRSSIHFLAVALTFASRSKNSQLCPSNQVSAVAKTSVSDEKWRRHV
jgi:hypothetical protein